MSFKVCRVACSQRAKWVSLPSLDVDRENLAWLAAFSLHLHLPAAPLSSFFPHLLTSLSPFPVSAREISRNPSEARYIQLIILSEALPETSERRSPPKARHGYNRDLHQIYRRVSAVRRAREVSDRCTAAFVFRVYAHCIVYHRVASV